MYERAKNYTLMRPRLKKTVGWLFVLLGFLALITPLTPGGFLFIVGLELLGLRLLFVERFMKRKVVPVPIEK